MKCACRRARVTEKRDAFIILAVSLIEKPSPQTSHAAVPASSGSYPGRNIQSDCRREKCRVGELTGCGAIMRSLVLDSDMSVASIDGD